MKNPKIEGRLQYQPSGRIRWAPFLSLAALSVLAACLLAVALAILFTVGFYIVVIVPVLAALGLGFMVSLAAKRGHCRNPKAVVALAIVSAIILYVGHYYVGMVHALGPEYATEISLLPKYIRFRMKTTVLKDVHTPDSKQNHDAPSGFRTGMNWTLSVLEFGFIIAVTAGFGLSRARKPYCEKCGMWMTREITTFKPELGPGFVEALRLGSVQSLAALFTSPPKPAAPHTAVALDYCPHLKERTDCDLFLSIKLVVSAATGITANAFEQSKGKMLAHQVQLAPEEIPALLGRFPSLEKVAGTTAAQALQELQVEVKPVSAQVMAEVKPVEPPYAGNILTTKTGLLITGFSLLGLLAVFGAIGLGALGSHLGFPDSIPAGGVAPAMKVLGSALIGLAILIFVINFIMLFTVPDYLGTRYLRRFTQRELSRRPRPLVNPADSAARFVQVIPRANWAKLKLIDATDIGFLRVDMERGELLFEGDKECYRIAAAAITSCDIETFVAGEGSHGATTLFRVVVQANHPTGFWEVPFAERGNSGKFRKKSREKWARELQQKICGLMAANQPQTNPA